MRVPRRVVGDTRIEVVIADDLTKVNIFAVGHEKEIAHAHLIYENIDCRRIIAENCPRVGVRRLGNQRSDFFFCLAFETPGLGPTDSDESVFFKFFDAVDAVERKGANKPCANHRLLLAAVRKLVDNYFCFIVYGRYQESK